MGWWQAVWDFEHVSAGGPLKSLSLSLTIIQDLVRNYCALRLLNTAFCAYMFGGRFPSFEYLFPLGKDNLGHWFSKNFFQQRF